MKLLEEFLAHFGIIHDPDSPFFREHHFSIGPFELIRRWRQQKIRLQVGPVALAVEHGRAPGESRSESANWFVMLFLGTHGMILSVGGLKSWDLWTV